MTQDTTPATGTLATALAHAAGLLAQDPGLAEAQAREILRAMPGHPEATLILAIALRRQGGPGPALEVLEPVIRAHPGWPPVHQEAGLALAELGLGRAAVAAFNRAVALNPKLTAAWAVVAFVGLGISLPSAPGFVGVFQAAIVLALALFGVPRAEALSFSLLYHASQYVPITSSVDPPAAGAGQPLSACPAWHP